MNPPPRIRTLPEQSGSLEANEPSANNVENSAQEQQHLAARATDAVRPRVGVVAVAVLAAFVGIIVWLRRRR
jgi:hypothetical protein